MALKPGLILINSVRVKEKNCPPIFKKWEKIYFEDVVPISEAELKKLILKNNQEYKISSVSNFENSKLKSKILRNYYHNNILAFGDMLHQIHPLAGQCFNMAIRDLKSLLSICVIGIWHGQTIIIMVSVFILIMCISHQGVNMNTITMIQPRGIYG